ncbi:MAG: hypothetical protein ACJAUT_000968 [Cellvibrionaceae bacterium]|jgi:hypothetical protein
MYKNGKNNVEDRQLLKSVVSAVKMNAWSKAHQCSFI